MVMDFGVEKRAVRCTRLVKDGYEYCVYFDETSWNIDTDGLIYTDPQWLSELNTFLQGKGFDETLDYTEAGMQGRNYVSLEISKS